MAQHQETIYKDAPATAAVSDPTHNLIQAMSEKLDAVWRYDVYLEDCDDDSCSDVFQTMKQDDMRHVEMLRGEIERHCKEGTFR